MIPEVVLPSESAKADVAAERSFVGMRPLVDSSVVRLGEPTTAVGTRVDGGLAWNGMCGGGEVWKVRSPMGRGPTVAGDRRR